MDNDFKGSSFTWANKRAGEDVVWERLDRAIANILRRQNFPYAFLMHERMIGSAAFGTGSQWSFPQQERGFKFESRWTTSDRCREMKRLGVSNKWDQFQVARSLRGCAKNFECGVKKNLVTQRMKWICWWKNELEDIQLKALSTPVHDKENQFLQELDQAWMQEEMYWHQRSRINWIHFGDRNSKFFHAIQRRIRNLMVRIKDRNGQWLENEEDIRNEALKLLFPTTNRGSYFLKSYVSQQSSALLIIIY